MSEVKIFKLVNGDEIIGEVVDSSTDEVTVKNPLSIMIVRGANGQPAKALSDWVMLAPGISKIRIYTHSLLVAPIEAPKSSADAWRQETSGIVLATQLNG